MKIKKTKQIHRGDPVYYDENGRMFVESGNARVYFNQEKAKKSRQGRGKRRRYEVEGYQPKNKIKNVNSPKGGSGVPNKKPIILTMKDIDKLHIYFTNREIAHILWFG